ncbi:MAG: PKD domain-containing protein [Bacteroidales bacterium]
MKKLWFSITGIGLLLLCLSGIVKAQTVSINLNTGHQIIRGFGGMNNPGWIDDLNSDQTDKAFGNAPGQIGLSILRMRISSKSDEFNLELPTAQRAKGHGALLMASPWSPPASLKSNNSTTGGYLLSQNYDAYADHLLGFANFMKNNSVPLDAISIQNEPDIKVNYESCDWSAKQMIDFLKTQGSKFDTLKVIAAESFQFRRPITDSILNDAGAEQHVDIIGGHIYGGGLSDYPLARTKGKEVWMTEHLTGSGSPSENTWSLALDMATEINNCMKANFNAYLWWYIRRFYSFIDEGGNITKKGYAMAQFSKFIRPGFVRVGSTVASAPNVDVTAYKSGDSMVIVVINRNNANVNLTFQIENNIADSLTKYTTSAAKNISNDGKIAVTSGSFNAVVDAYSITTFSSVSDNAGKFENSKPTANAGSDIEKTLESTGLKADVTLNGTQSYDTDGEIVNYSWSLDGKQIAWDSTAVLQFGPGEYPVILTVTDNDGARDTDTVHIKVMSQFQTNIWFEAECAQVGANWLVITDNLASNAKYVTVPAGRQSLAQASEDTKDHLVFTFSIIEEAQYILWGRANAPTWEDDSYWVKMNDGVWAVWNGIRDSGTGTGWHWDDVHDGSGTTMVYNLDSGMHTLLVCYREDGAGLDKLLLSNTGTVPSGIGETATNCQQTNVYEVDNGSTSLVVWPNPVKTEITVRWGDEIQTVVVIDITGRILIQEEYNTPSHSVQIPVSLNPGIYVVKVCNNKKSDLIMIMVE